jgi:hypothetical protein
MGRQIHAICIAQGEDCPLVDAHVRTPERVPVRRRQLTAPPAQHPPVRFLGLPLPSPHVVGVGMSSSGAASGNGAPPAEFTNPFSRYPPPFPNPFDGSQKGGKPKTLKWCLWEVLVRLDEGSKVQALVAPGSPLLQLYPKFNTSKNPSGQVRGPATPRGSPAALRRHRCRSAACCCRCLPVRRPTTPLPATPAGERRVWLRQEQAVHPRLSRPGGRVGDAPP